MQGRMQSNLLKITAAVVVSLIVLCGTLPVLWRPWLSANGAAEYLVMADGKGLNALVPIAARSWGWKIYRPLSDRTNKFNNFEHFIELTVLMDIIENDKRENVADIYLELLNSSSISARMLGLMAARVHGLPVENARVREAEVTALLSENAVLGPFDIDDSKVRVALQVIRRSRLPGAVPVIQPYLLSGSPNYWTVVAACDALTSVPERAAASKLLVEALSQPHRFPRARCAEALALISRQAALSTLDQALAMETDAEEARGLRRLLEELREQKK